MKTLPAVFAVLLSATVIAQDRIPTHDEAVLALKREGVRVSPTRRRTIIIGIDQDCDDSDPAVFRNLRWVANVEEVVINTAKADERLERLPKEMSFKVLDVTHATDKGLRHVSKHTGLKTLVLNGQGITDAGLPALETLKDLEKLRLYDTKVTKPGIQKLYKSLPKCLAEIN